MKKIVELTNDIGNFKATVNQLETEASEKE